MLNTQTNEFLTKLVNLVNASPLPVVNTRLCLDIVRAQLVEAERAAIEQERQQTEKAKAKKEDRK
ncbi:MAG: hypothetical protein LIO95_07230 [Clostridiales bacterium]|nr:hypothetical protein [Clostridiales bacterium]